MRNLSPPLFILIILAIGFSISMDIFIPALPEMQKELSTSTFLVQLTLTIPMWVMGISLVVLGRCCDLWGRRPIALSGAVVFFVGALTCATAGSIYTLHLGRFLQSLGAAGMYVAAFTMARDLSATPQQASKVFGWMQGSCGVSPMLAPLVGGYLIAWGGWRMTFFFCLVLAIVSFSLASFHAHETRHPITRRSAQRDYLTAIKDSSFSHFIWPSMAGMACIFSYFSISPFVLMDFLGLSEQAFGWFFAIIASGFLLGSVVNAPLSAKIGLPKVNALGGALFLLSGIGLVIDSLFFFQSPIIYVLLVLPSAAGVAFFLASGVAGALQKLSHIAGTAIAILGFFQYLFAGIVGTIIMHFLNGTALSLGIALLVMGPMGFVPLLRRKHDQSIS